MERNNMRFVGKILTELTENYFWFEEGEPLKELYKKFDNSFFLCYSKPRNEREVLKWKQSLIHIFVTT